MVNIGGAVRISRTFRKDGENAPLCNEIKVDVTDIRDYLGVLEEKRKAGGTVQNMCFLCILSRTHKMVPLQKKMKSLGAHFMVFLFLVF